MNTQRHRRRSWDWFGGGSCSPPPKKNGGTSKKPWKGLWRSRWNNYLSESENKKFILLIHQFNQAVSLLHPVLESHFIPDKDSSDNSLLQESTSFPGSFISPTQRGPRPSLTLGWGDERPWKRGCYKELSQSLLKQWRYSFFWDVLVHRNI